MLTGIENQTPPINGDDNGNQLIGTAGNDIINGNGGGDQIIGNAGDDILNGGDGGDQIIGGAGNDIITGGLGEDNIIGGAGIDTARFDDIDVPVTIGVDPNNANRIIATRDIGFNIAVEDQSFAAIEGVDADLVEEALAGNLYFNIHTTEFNSGEIRGQLLVSSSNIGPDGTGTIVLTAELDGAQEPDNASDSAATGQGTVTITVGADTISYDASLSVNGIAPSELLPVAGFSAIHLHNAPVGVNGPVVIDYIEDAGGLDAIIAISEEDEISSIEEVVFSDDGGEINVDGIIEAGNIVGDDNDNVLVGGPEDDNISGLDGNDILTGGLGDDTLDGGEGIDTVRFDDIDVPVEVDLVAGTATRETGFSVVVDGVPLASLTTPQSPADLVEEAAAGNLYYNIHTNDFNGGEIRGQLLVSSDETVDGVRTLVLDASLDAAQEPDPLSDSEATGTGTVAIVVDAEGVVTYSSDLSVTGLATSDLLPVAGVSSIHLHNAPAGINGPVIADIIQDAGGDVNGASIDLVAFPDGNVFAEVTETDTLINIENVVGSNDADVLQGDANANVLSGLDGSDELVGRGGADELFGGLGDDILRGGGGTDIIDGGEGIDTADFSDIGASVIVDLSAGTGVYQGPNGTVTDTILNIENLIGSANDDILIGAVGDNLLDGGAGNDTLTGGDDRDTFLFRRGNGSDTVTDFRSGVVAGDFLDVSDFGITRIEDVNAVQDGANTIITLAQGEQVTLENVSPEELVAENFVFAEGGEVAEEVVIVENLNLNGGNDNDVLEGQAGNDVINAGNGDDDIVGGAGDDNLFGNNGDDNIEAGLGNDIISGSRGDDDLFGGAGNDLISGGRGNDNAQGGSGNDLVEGGRGNDILDGGDGDDIICGGLGDDILIAGAGNDRLDGRQGNDTFVFASDFGDDVITDFFDGEDQLDLTSADFDFDTFNDLADSISQDGNNVVIDLGDEGSITLLGIQVTDLTEDNVLV